MLTILGPSGLPQWVHVECPPQWSRTGVHAFMEQVSLVLEAGGAIRAPEKGRAQEGELWRDV